MYINNQQNYISNGLYAHKSNNSKNSKGTISEYKGILHCEGYGYEEISDAVMEVPLSEPLFSKRMQMLSWPNGIMFYGKLGADFFYFFSSSEMLNPNMKNRLRLIRAKTNFYKTSHNPNFSLGIFDFSLYTRRIALKDGYHKKRTDKLAFTPVHFYNLEYLAKTFIIPAIRNQLNQ